MRRVLLSCKTTIRVNEVYANIIGHMCYAAGKLWNIGNYERNQYDGKKTSVYPDWYYQKSHHKDHLWYKSLPSQTAQEVLKQLDKAWKSFYWYYQKSHHKDHLWYKSLPSQTAQEVLKQLDKAWKSFFRLKKTGGIENPHPPGYKQEKMVITYMQNALVHEAGSCHIRLSIPKQLKEYMKLTYDISENYLYLENKIFQSTDIIKQIKVYPPEEKGICRVIVIYEVSDAEMVTDTGHYLSIDLGLHNLMTCYDSMGTAFILGRRYLNICHYYDRKIAAMQSQWAKCQVSGGIRYLKPSKHLKKVYQKRKDCINDYLHKLTHYIAEYCQKQRIAVVVIGDITKKPSKHLKKVYQKRKDCINDYLHKLTHYIAEYCQKQRIAVVVIGDITNIRKGKKLGKVTNQKLHSLPYKRIYELLTYKLKRYGIRLVLQNEAYTSQCAPDTPEISEKYAVPSNRIHRGLYKNKKNVYHADAVGAFNIMRKYFALTGIEQKLPMSGLAQITVIKAAV